MTTSVDKPLADVRALLLKAAKHVRDADEAVLTALALTDGADLSESAEEKPAPGPLTVDELGRITVTLPEDEARHGIWITAWPGALEDRPGRSPVSSGLLKGVSTYTTRELTTPGPWTVEIAEVPSDHGGPGWGGVVRTWHTVEVPVVERQPASVTAASHGAYNGFGELVSTDDWEVHEVSDPIVFDRVTDRELMPKTILRPRGSKPFKCVVVDQCQRVTQPGLAIMAPTVGPWISEANSGQSYGNNLVHILGGEDVSIDTLVTRGGFAGLRADDVSGLKIDTLAGWHFGRHSAVIVRPKFSEASGLDVRRVLVTSRHPEEYEESGAVPSFSIDGFNVYKPEWHETRRHHVGVIVAIGADEHGFGSGGIVDGGCHDNRATTGGPPGGAIEFEHVLACCTGNKPTALATELDSAIRRISAWQGRTSPTQAGARATGTAFYCADYCDMNKTKTGHRFDPPAALMARNVIENVHANWHTAGKQRGHWVCRDDVYYGGTKVLMYKAHPDPVTLRKINDRDADYTLGQWWDEAEEALSGLALPDLPEAYELTRWRAYRDSAPNAV